MLMPIETFISCCRSTCPSRRRLGSFPIHLVGPSRRFVDGAPEQKFTIFLLVYLSIYASFRCPLDYLPPQGSSTRRKIDSEQQKFAGGVSRCDAFPTSAAFPTARLLEISWHLRFPRAECSFSSWNPRNLERKNQRRKTSL